MTLQFYHRISIAWLPLMIFGGSLCCAQPAGTSPDKDSSVVEKGLGIKILNALRDNRPEDLVGLVDTSLSVAPYLPLDRASLTKLVKNYSLAIKAGGDSSEIRQQRKERYRVQMKSRLFTIEYSLNEKSTGRVKHISLITAQPGRSVFDLEDFDYPNSNPPVVYEFQAACFVALKYKQADYVKKKFLTAVKRTEIEKAVNYFHNKLARNYQESFFSMSNKSAAYYIYNDADSSDLHVVVDYDLTASGVGIRRIRFFSFDPRFNSYSIPGGIITNTDAPQTKGKIGVVEEK